MYMLYKNYKEMTSETNRFPSLSFIKGITLLMVNTLSALPNISVDQNSVFNLSTRFYLWFHVLVDEFLQFVPLIFCRVELSLDSQGVSFTH